MRKVKWVKLVTRPQTALTVNFVLQGLKRNFKKLVGTNLDVKGEFNEEFGTIFEGENSRKLVNSIFEKKYKANPKFFKKHVDMGESIVLDVISKTKNMSADITKLNKDSLLRRFEEFEAIYYKFIPLLHTVFSPEQILTIKLKNQINRFIEPTNEENIEDYFRILTTVQEETDFFLEQKDLHLIACEYKKGKKIDTKLEAHAKRYGYMGLTNSFLSDPYDKNHFLSLIKEIKDPEFELKQLEDNRRQELKRYRDMIANLPGDILRTSKLIQTYMLFRNRRIEGLKKSQQNLKPLLIEISKRFNEQFENIIWYTTDEVKKLLATGRKMDVSSRKKYFSMELVNGKITQKTKKTTRKSKTKITEFKGSVASLGKVTGKVKLVFSSKEVNKIKTGDILVTTMTTPDFVVAMKKSAAIVTDEGGILSHAAIVSREFGIPCVIGTKIATKVLKDGDLVEVNAVDGVIRKL